jgi:phosphoribosylanthranilate isomerase
MMIALNHDVDAGPGQGRFLVKVCGLTRAEDVALCAELGVDWTGFIFYPASPRNISVELAAALPRGRALRVGVFVRQDAHEVCRIMDRAGLDLAQLHGGQDASFCRVVGPRRVIKVFWPQRYPDLAELERDMRNFAPVCKAMLLDAGTSGGGHGQNLDFAVLRGLKCPKPWLLAGGLGPENIHAALGQCAPNGVDLNSGVEHAPGRKSGEMLRDAVRLIRMKQSFKP